MGPSSSRGLMSSSQGAIATEPNHQQIGPCPLCGFGRNVTLCSMSELGPQADLDPRDCEVSFTPVNRHHQLDRQPSEFSHLLCLSIASSSSSSDRGEMPSTRNPGKLSEAVVSICISST